MARKVKCLFCGEQFDRDNVEFVQVKNRYAHKECFDKAEANKSQEENLNALRYYINHTYDNKFLINSINGIIYKEAKRYKALRDLVFVVKKEQIKEEVKTKQLSLFDK